MTFIMMGPSNVLDPRYLHVVHMKWTLLDIIVGFDGAAQSGSRWLFRIIWYVHVDTFIHLQSCLNVEASTSLGLKGWCNLSCVANFYGIGQF